MIDFLKYPEMKPSFRIHRTDGSVVPSIKNAFVTKKTLSYEDIRRGYLILEDGTEWQLVMDSETSDKIFRDKRACMVSFQAHSYGNFAVVRIITPRPNIQP